MAQVFVVCLVVVILSVILSFFAGLADAQGCMTTGGNYLMHGCGTHLTGTLPSPDYTCCVFATTISMYGPMCLCQAILQASSTPSSAGTINMNRAYALASACRIDADMSKCSGSSTSPPGSTTPPSSSGGFYSPPYSGYSPSFKAPTPPEDSSPNLAGPIAGGVGGATALGIILFVIAKFTNCFRCHLHYNINPGQAAAGKPTGGNGRPAGGDQQGSPYNVNNQRTYNPNGDVPGFVNQAIPGYPNQASPQYYNQDIRPAQYNMPVLPR